jgi:hypothetical protein
VDAVGLAPEAHVRIAYGHGGGQAARSGVVGPHAVHGRLRHRLREAHAAGGVDAAAGLDEIVARLRAFHLHARVGQDLHGGGMDALHVVRGKHADRLGQHRRTLWTNRYDAPTKTIRRRPTSSVLRSIAFM